MNRPNRHMRYRRSVYRKNQIRIGITISVIALVVLFLLFVIIGNVFFSKVNEPGDTENDPPANEGTLPDIPADHEIHELSEFPALLESLW